MAKLRIEKGQDDKWDVYDENNNIIDNMDVHITADHVVKPYVQIRFELESVIIETKN
jgi:hypothetical protein